MIKANRLCEGDVVGLVCPSGRVREKRLEKSVDTLKSMGLRVKLGDHAGESLGYFAGSDEHRAEDINKMFADPEVKGIFCVRGGFGATRILHMLDYATIRCNPKIVIGYSDITALHLAIGRRTGLVTFHGPMTAEMTEKFPEYNRSYLERALFCPRPIGEVINPRDTEPPVTLFPGRAEGPLRGGNLSLLCATIGTCYEIDTRGCIFFVEEIGEPPYKIDRMLTHLKMAGKFRDAVAVLFGQWKDCADEKYPGRNMDSLLAETAACAGKPCISNMMIGHDKYNITIPLNCRGLVEAGKLYITESGVL